MGDESLWGWFVVAVALSTLAGFMILVSTDTATLLAGIALGILSGAALQVTTIGIGVQIGMARHEHLKNRRSKA